MPPSPRCYVAKRIQVCERLRYQSNGAILAPWIDGVFTSHASAWKLRDFFFQCTAAVQCRAVGPNGQTWYRKPGTKARDGAGNRTRSAPKGKPEPVSRVTPRVRAGVRVSAAAGQEFTTSFASFWLKYCLRANQWGQLSTPIRRSVGGASGRPAFRSPSLLRVRENSWVVVMVWAQATLDVSGGGSRGRSLPGLEYGHSPLAPRSALQGHNLPC